MSYNLTLTNGSVLVVLADGTADTTTTSINLIGKNYAGYGALLNENFIKLLENFSASVAPLNPLQGQLWWDSTNRQLNVYQGTNWKVISSSQTGTTSPINPVTGDFWWDTQTSQFLVWDGSQWIAIGPATPPGQALTELVGNVLADTAYVNHLVGNVLINNKLGMIVSTDSGTFSLPMPISGLSTISPGINFTTTTEPTMISSPNMSFGVTNGNVVMTSVGNNFGINFVETLNNVPTNVLSFSGVTGLGVVHGDPVSTFGIATKNYTDTSITNLRGYIDTANLNVVSYTNDRLNGLQTSLTNLINTELGSVTTGGVTFSTSLIPTANLVYDIGSVTNWWNNIYGTSVHAQYADLAERYHADVEYPVGTVVQIGGANEVTMVEDALSDDIFGVISSAPAYLMNSTAGPNSTHPPVALAGRVPVRVVGQVRKGDRLVSAGNGLARAGVMSATVSELTPWNVIGRALEDKYSEGESLVEAVVRIN
jgi:hypothetical protein